MTHQSSERLVVVANRLPVRRAAGAGWETSPGGLVSAIAPVLRDRKGAWVGWDGATGDPQAASAPFEHDGMRVHPVGIDRDERDGFYYGFSNETLWPLYHDAIRFPRFHRRWWGPYVSVNERFAAAAAEVASDGADIWVHDYQLQLAPAMIRRRIPDCRIGFFLHIPFPPEELFAKMPWRRQVLEGLLGADVIGFQTSLSAENFVRAAEKLTSASRVDSGLEHEGRRIAVEAFPISIDYRAFRDMAATEKTRVHADELRESLGNRRIVLGVDRMDYTKGIDVRLRAYEDALERGYFGSNEVVMMQVAVPSREGVGEYADLRRSVEEHVGRINGRFSAAGLPAVYYIYRGLPFQELIAAYRAAEVMLITPFRDGMNLVAKEFCASQIDAKGSLVLSEFAGAALELQDATLVNPYDIDGMSAALDRALRLDPEDRVNRMRSLQRVVSRHDVHAWANSFLGALSAARVDPEAHEPVANA